MIREHLHEQLEDWIVASEKSVIPDLANFATGLRKDFDAIFSALKTGAFAKRGARLATKVAPKGLRLSGRLRGRMICVRVGGHSARRRS